MPRYRRRGRKKKGKWRQQKLAVGTVQKIARRVAKYQIQELEEPKFSVNLLGGRPGNNTEDVVRCIITRSGLFEVAPQATGFLSNTAQYPIQIHPITYPYDVVQGQAGQVEKVTTGYGMRAGNTIMLKGLGLKGYLCLGKDCANARVHVGIYKSENNLTDPQSFLPELDGMQLRREIDTTEKLNGTKCKRTYTLNHRANENEVKVPINLYLPVNKRIKYGKNQPDRDSGVMSQIYFDDLRYYLIMYSDRKDTVLAGGIGNTVVNADQTQIYDSHPTFYGRWTAYYRDA